MQHGGLSLRVKHQTSRVVLTIWQGAGEEAEGRRQEAEGREQGAGGREQYFESPCNQTDSIVFNLFMWFFSSSPPSLLHSFTLPLFPSYPCLFLTRVIKLALPWSQICKLEESVRIHEQFTIECITKKNRG